MRANSRQLCALGFCAFTVPAVLILPRVGWFWATAVSAACALLLALLAALRQKGADPAETAAGSSVGKGLLLLALGWNLLLLGASATQLCAIYPTGRTFPLIGLLLLVLAVYASQKGISAVLRVGAIVFFFLLPIYALILGFSLPKLHGEWLNPVFSARWTYFPAVLVPVTAVYLRGDWESGRVWPWLLGGVVFAGLCALSTAGSLSPAVAAGETFPFYSAAKSVSVLGAMERLEPLVSAAMTAGGFCLLALLCAANRQMLEKLFPSAGGLAAALNLLLGGAAMWLSKLIPGVVLAVGTTIFWGLFPLCILLLGARKNFKKLRKKC